MDSKIRARRQQAFTLTVIGCALTAVVGWMLGPMITALAVLALPVPLFLLWFSADVFRFDERHEDQARVSESEKPVLRRPTAQAS